MSLSTAIIREKKITWQITPVSENQTAPTGVAAKMAIVITPKQIATAAPAKPQ